MKYIPLLFSPLVITCAGLLGVSCGGADGPRQLPREPKGAVALVSLSTDESAESNVGAVELTNAPATRDRATPDAAVCQLDTPVPQSVSMSMDAASLHLLGQRKIQEKERQDAVMVLQKANELSPDNALIKADYATALLQCGFIQQGVETMESSAMLAPENADIAANLGQAYQIAGRYRAARIIYEKAAALAPNDSAIRNNLAVVLVALGDVDAAEAEIRKAIALDSNEIAYLVDLGYILVRQQRLQDAKIILERALITDNNSADAYNMLGFVYFQLHHRSRAQENFKKALSINPQHRAAKENLDALNAEFQSEVE